MEVTPLPTVPSAGPSSPTSSSLNGGNGGGGGTYSSVYYDSVIAVEEEEEEEDSKDGDVLPRTHSLRSRVGYQRRRSPTYYPTTDSCFDSLIPFRRPTSSSLARFQASSYTPLSPPLTPQMIPTSFVVDTTVLVVALDCVVIAVSIGTFV